MKTWDLLQKTVRLYMQIFSVAQFEKAIKENTLGYSGFK